MTTKPKQRQGVLSPYISVVPSLSCNRVLIVSVLLLTVQAG